jgi:hypothetical protein
MTTLTGIRVLDDAATGLRYLSPLGPHLPGLDSAGLAYVRDDLLRRAAGAEQQARDAWDERNIGLVQRCEGIASTCRETARQLVRYCTDPAWMVTE